MLLTPYDLEGSNGAVFEEDGTVRIEFSDGSPVIMEPGKGPYCVAEKGRNDVHETFAMNG
jgi:hypothetical protein